MAALFPETDYSVTWGTAHCFPQGLSWHLYCIASQCSMYFGGIQTALENKHKQIQHLNDVVESPHHFHDLH